MKLTDKPSFPALVPKGHTLIRHNAGGPKGPDLIGFVGGRRIELDVVPAPRKRCLSCGRLQNDDGTLDCGH